MTHKKDPTGDQKNTASELENRVYEMMELDRGKVDSPIAMPQSMVSATAEEQDPIDIFKGLKTPPAVELKTETETETDTTIVPASVADLYTNDFDDIVTDQVIKDITVSESDALLAAEDTVARNHLL